MYATSYLRRPRAQNCGARKRAALYVLGHRHGARDLIACARQARLADCRIVAMACDEDDELTGAPRLCVLMDRLGEGEFEIIFGKANGRHVVIELEGGSPGAVVMR